MVWMFGWSGSLEGRAPRGTGWLRWSGSLEDRVDGVVWESVEHHGVVGTARKFGGLNSSGSFGVNLLGRLIYRNTMGCW